ncbi:MAG: hypothetical protein FD119_2816 [Stygiobacter sp.]|nr:MAG: hypothetical protein FD119_2816 [Stygiobacter sp.]
MSANPFLLPPGGMSNDPFTVGEEEDPFTTVSDPFTAVAEQPQVQASVNIDQSSIPAIMQDPGAREIIAQVQQQWGDSAPIFAPGDERQATWDEYQRQTREQAQAPVSQQEQRNGALDTTYGIVNGVVGAANSTWDLGVDLAETALTPVAKLVGDEAGLAQAANGMRAINTSKAPEPRYLVGKLTEGVVQAGTGFVMGAKTLKAMGWAAEGAGVGRAMVAGGIGDFVAFDEHEKRLSNLIVDEFPEVAPAFMEYLAAKPDDSWAVGRFKNVVEGATIGGAGDILFRMIRGTKDIRAMLDKGDKAGADKAMTELADTVDAGIAVHEGRASPEQLELFNNLHRQDAPIEKRVREAEGGGLLGGGKGGKKADLAADRLKADGNDLAGVGENVRRVIDGETTGIGSWGFGLSDADVKTMRSNLEQARDGAMPWNEALKGMPFNVDHMKGADDAKALIKLVTDEVAKYMPTDFTGTQSHATVRELAEEFGARPNELLNAMREMAGAAEKVPAMMVATKAIKMGLGEKYVQAVRLVDAGKMPEDQADRIFNLYLNTMTDLKAVIKMGARVTSAGNIDVTAAEARNMKKLDRAVDTFQATGDKRKFMKQVAVLGDDPSVLSKVINWVADHRMWDVHNEVWINALLSGPKTHIVNMTSNLINVGIKPLENALGHALQGDIRSAKYEIASYAGMVKGFDDAIRAAGIALKMEDNILDPSHGFQDVRPKATGDGIAGQAIRAPSRALAAEDEFFKQIAYRGKIYSLAVQSAANANLSRAKTVRMPDGRKVSPFEKHVEEYFDGGFDRYGAGTNEKALQFAREATFTQDLGAGTFGHTVQQAASKHPSLRAVVPFVRTPTNIIRSAWQHTPLIGALQRQMKEDFVSGDPSRRAAYIGKQAIGTAVFGSAVAMALEGKITGGGPKDPNLRRIMMEKDSNWQPYSFKIGDKFYSFERIEPFGTMFGIIGDYAEIAQEMSDTKLEEMSAGMVTAFIANVLTGDPEAVNAFGGGTMRAMMSTAKNLSNKTYLQGVFQVMDVITSGNPLDGERFLKDRVGSYVPNVLRQTNPDPYYREVRTVLDSLKAGVPGWSKTLPPRYNFIGEPAMKPGSPLDRFFNPIKDKDGSPDTLMAELTKLQHPFAAVSPKLGNIDLTTFVNPKTGKDAFVRLNELVGETGVREELTALVKGPMWGSLTDDVNTETMSYVGSKPMEVMRTLESNRKIAMERLQTEGFTAKDGSSDLLTAIAHDKMNRQLNKGGGADVLLPLK